MTKTLRILTIPCDDGRHDLCPPVHCDCSCHPAPFIDRTPTPEMALVCIALWWINRPTTLAGLADHCLRQMPYFAALSNGGTYRHVSRYVEQCEAAGFVTTRPTSFAGSLLVDITATGLIVAEGGSDQAYFL